MHREAIATAADRHGIIVSARREAPASAPFNKEREKEPKIA
jgi:hypothetical protein